MNHLQTGNDRTDLIEHQASDVDPSTVLVIFQCQRCRWDTNWVRRDANELTPPPCPNCNLMDE